MQIVTGQSSPVETSGTGPTSGFRIETNAYAFQMLSSGVYSDKISAVLREIGCNAADAHTAAGKRDMPFEVKLPTQLDPQFWIKDCGPGLDEDGVRGLYTTYFSSTKRDSNDFTGAFGLGSKSPFSSPRVKAVVSAPSLHIWMKTEARSLPRPGKVPRVKTGRPVYASASPCGRLTSGNSRKKPSGCISGFSRNRLSKGCRLNGQYQKGPGWRTKP
jgi:hypothetical protein